MNTYIEVNGTSIIGWSSGAPATENFFAFDFTPEKPLDAYEYVDVTETHTVADPNDPENATIEITTVVDTIIQERADWVEPTPPE
jgi:hypothetical protein